MPNWLRLWIRPFRTLGAFALLWLATLALGIAVSTVSFTQLRYTLLQPLELPGADRLFAVVRHQGKIQGAELTRGLLDEVNRIKGLEAAGSIRQPQRLSGEGLVAQQVTLLRVTPNWVRVLGVKPQLGRALSPNDADSDTVMISDALWRLAFDSDPKILQRSISVSGERKSIVGVLGREMQRVAREDVFLGSRFADVPSETDYAFQVIARRFSNLDEAHLQDHLAQALQARRVSAAPAYRDESLQLQAIDLHAHRMIWVRETLMPLLALVALLVALMACNASSLFAVSVLERIHALAIESALGAQTSMLLRQIALQSLLFSGIAALLALPICPLLFGIARSHFLGGSPALTDVQFDPVALYAVAGFFAALNLLAAMLPTHLILRRINLSRAGRTLVTTAGARFARSALAFQLIAATAVVMLAMLLLRSWQNLNDVAPGFDAKHLWSAQLVLPNRTDTGKPDKDASGMQANVEFMETVALAVKKLPGVLSASFASEVPLGLQRGNRRPIVVDGAQADSVGEKPYAQLRAIDPDYAEVLGVRLVAGRMPRFQPKSGEQEAALNARYVERFMSGASPLNRFLDGAPVRIVGVLADFKQVALDADVEPDLYIPLALDRLNEVTLLLRVPDAPTQALEDQVRAVVQNVDPSVPVSSVLSGIDLRDASIQDRTSLARLLTLFATLSVFTTALGLFSLSAYSVTKRVREFGLRLAVGAAPLRLMREVMFENLRFCGACAAAGWVIGALFSEILADKLYVVRWFDFPSALAAIAMMLSVCLLAAIIPAWRASRTEPTYALKGQ